MFGDIIKIGIRTAAVVAVVAVVVGIFESIQIPAIDFSNLTSPMGIAYAFINHWMPGMGTLVDIAVNLLKIEVALTLAWFAIIAIQWILKINV